MRRAPLRFVGVVWLAVASAGTAWLQPGSIEQSRETREALRHYAAGTRAMATEHYADAAEEYQAAVRLDRLLIIAHYGLGQAYMALKQYPKAVRAYLACREAYREDVKSQIDRRAFWEQRLTSEIGAIEDQLAAAASGAPGGGGLPQNKMPLSAATPDRMRDLLDSLRTRAGRSELVMQDAPPPWISVALGSAYYREGAYADAEREYRAALRVDPSVGEAYLDLAVLYLSTNRADDCARELAAAVKAGISVPDGLRADLARLRPPDGGAAEAIAAKLLLDSSRDRPGALATLLAWEPDRLARFASGTRPADAGVALMLLTDAAAKAREGGRSAVALDSAAAEIARRVSQDVQLGQLEDPRPIEFVRRWYLATALLAQADTRWGDALDWAERGAKAFPESADLYSAIASAEEILAFQSAASVGEETIDRPRNPGAAAAEVRQHLGRALATARSAVALAPERVDLKVRLARIAWKLGDLASARSTLESLPSGSGADAYLAALFLGRVEQDEGRLEQAKRRYEAAVALQPAAQAARLALSHVELLMGDDEGARREAEAAIRTAGFRSANDPFWVYPWNISGQARGLFETLRQEARR